MKKYCKALVNLGVAFIILLLIVFLVPKLLVFFAPFVAGWIIALIASPLVRFLRKGKDQAKSGKRICHRGGHRTGDIDPLSGRGEVSR